MIEVLEAYQEGKTIQVYSQRGNSWIDEKEPVWDFTVFTYRIKPEEKIYFYRIVKDVNNLKKGDLFMTSVCKENDNFKLISKEQYENNSLSYKDNWLLGMKAESTNLDSGNEEKILISFLRKKFIGLSNNSIIKYEEFFNNFKFID